jgi:hypothetical protein
MFGIYLLGLDMRNWAGKEVMQSWAVFNGSQRKRKND